MRAQFVIPVLASILILGTMGFSYDAFAENHGNNGNNGCVNANPNAKACEKNPNINHPPTIGSVTVTSTLIVTTLATFNLTCIANNIFDEDGDEVSLTYSWHSKKLGEPIGGVIGTDSTLVVTTTVDTFTYICEVTPFDGIDFGTTVNGSFTLAGVVVI